VIVYTNPNPTNLGGYEMRSSSVFFMISVLLVITSIFTYAENKACACFFDHTDPPPEFSALPDKIGEYAGFGALGEFIRQGGFECPQNIIDQIITTNKNYQDNEYIPRYEEAKAIHQWLTAVHVISTPDNPVICPVCGIAHTWSQYKAMVLEKVARRDQITTEIDTIAENLQLSAWELIPEASKTAYMAWVEALKNH
jgi:hypothetical protein